MNPDEQRALPEDGSWTGVSRRGFVQLVVAAGGIASTGGTLEAESTDGPASTHVSVVLTINKQPLMLQLDPRVTLLDLLRDQLELTGTKKGCGHGQCGACTLLIDGRRVNSCLTLAVTCDGAEVTTIEGLADGGQLHPMQQSFLDHDGFQCGYCTPGQICSAVALLDEVKSGAPSFVTSDVRRLGSIELTDDEIRERMSGNICRCSAYPNIVAAVRTAAERANANS